MPRITNASEATTDRLRWRCWDKSPERSEREGQKERKKKRRKNDDETLHEQKVFKPLPCSLHTSLNLAFLCPCHSSLPSYERRSCSLEQKFLYLDNISLISLSTLNLSVSLFLMYLEIGTEKAREREKERERGPCVEDPHCSLPAGKIPVGWNWTNSKSSRGKPARETFQQQHTHKPRATTAVTTTTLAIAATTVSISNSTTSRMRSQAAVVVFLQRDS